MALADVCCKFAHGAGQFIGKSRNLLSSTRKALQESSGQLSAKCAEKIRTAMTERMARWLYKKAGSVLAKLGQRLQVVTEAMVAIQQKIDRSNMHIPVSQAFVVESVPLSSKPLPSEKKDT